jgi:stage III sporulation protein AG
VVSENVNINRNKWQKIILITLGLGIGVLLLVFGGAFDGGEKEQDSEVSLDVYAEADAYAEAVEKRVAELCASVKGAGEVKVLVSLSGGYRTVYATDAQSNSSGYKSEVVMSGSGSGQKAIITAYENPTIAGVGIVCEGGGDLSVRQEIIKLVSAALNISTNKIFVACSA